jgi:hypothetical protein
MGLSSEGIIFISIAWGVIITLTVYCYIRVFSSERKRKG